MIRILAIFTFTVVWQCISIEFKVSVIRLYAYYIKNEKIASNTHFYNGVFNRLISIEMKGVVNKDSKLYVFYINHWSKFINFTLDYYFFTNLKHVEDYNNIDKLWNNLIKTEWNCSHRCFHHVKTYRYWKNIVSSGVLILISSLIRLDLNYISCLQKKAPLFN